MRALDDKVDLLINLTFLSQGTFTCLRSVLSCLGLVILCSGEVGGGEVFGP